MNDRGGHEARVFSQRKDRRRRIYRGARLLPVWIGWPAATSVERPPLRVPGGHALARPPRPRASAAHHERLGGGRVPAPQRWPHGSGFVPPLPTRTVPLARRKGRVGERR